MPNPNGLTYEQLRNLLLTEQPIIEGEVIHEVAVTGTMPGHLSSGPPFGVNLRYHLGENCEVVRAVDSGANAPSEVPPNPSVIDWDRFARMPMEFGQIPVQPANAPTPRYRPTPAEVPCDPIPTPRASGRRVCRSRRVLQRNVVAYGFREGYCERREQGALIRIDSLGPRPSTRAQRPVRGVLLRNWSDPAYNNVMRRQGTVLEFEPHRVIPRRSCAVGPHGYMNWLEFTTVYDDERLLRTGAIVRRRDDGEEGDPRE